jgi:hypothetical protein
VTRSAVRKLPRRGAKQRVVSGSEAAAAFKTLNAFFRDEARWRAVIGDPADDARAAAATHACATIKEFLRQQQAKPS